MKKFGEWLIDVNLITEVQLKAALEKQQALSEHKMIGQLLVEMQALSMDELIKYSRDHIVYKQQFRNVE